MLVWSPNAFVSHISSLSTLSFESTLYTYNFNVKSISTFAIFISILILNNPKGLWVLEVALLSLLLPLKSLLGSATLKILPFSTSLKVKNISSRFYERFFHQSIPRSKILLPRRRLVQIEFVAGRRTPAKFNFHLVYLQLAVYIRIQGVIFCLYCAFIDLDENTLMFVHSF